MEKNNPPIGYYKSTRDYMAAADLLKLYKRFPIQRTVKKQLPKGVGPIKWRLQPKLPKQYLAIVPKGRVWGTNGSVIAPDNKLLWDVSFMYTTKPENHPIFRQKTLPSVSYIPETLAVLTFYVSYNYFHWMFDVLPRLELLRKSGVKYDRLVINRGILYQKENCTFQDETLELLGITKDQWIECDADTHLSAKELIVTSPTGFTSHVPKSVCQYIRNEFLEKRNLTKVNGCERIYISREDAPYRKVVNEEQVINVLKKYGFTKITLSTMTFQEKIQLFHSAKVIVSPHGAALTNLVFCNPETKVIEMFAPKYVIPCYYLISNHMDLDYYYLLGKGIPHEQVDHKNQGSMIIDIGKLERTLELAKLD